MVESSVTGHRNFDRVLSFKTLVFELEADSELSRYYDCFSLDRFFTLQTDEHRQPSCSVRLQNERSGDASDFAVKRSK